MATEVISNISSKYEDIISQSTLMSSGPPAVYQLKLKTDKFGTLTRMTLGEKSSNKTSRTILLVGETGAGKSTLINALFNYTMGVKCKDEVWFKIVEEERKESQAESQTSDVTVYEIFGFEDKILPYSLTIVDTPGYGDTGGTEHDVLSSRLLDLFRSENGVNDIHAVGLVMKASDNRLSDRLMYVFNVVMSLFGKNMEKNIVALITHSDGRKPKNAVDALKAANVKCARNENNKDPVYFLFNNCQDEDQTEEQQFMEHANKISEKGMKDFTAFLEKTKPKKLITTVEVLNERIRLTACIQNLKERIELAELKQKEIKQIQEALKKHEEETGKSEEFTVQVDEPYKDKEPIIGGMWLLLFYEGAVCCTICEENCHSLGCTMAWKPEHCEVMKRGHCTSCTRKCPASDHVKERWIYVTKTKKVEKTMKDVKEKYEKNGTEKETLNLLENLEKQMKQLTAKKFQLLNESYKHVDTLEQIALNVDSVSTIVHLDFLIEKMKEKEDTEKVQKLEEMKNRVNEGTRAALRYKQESGKQMH